MHKAIVICLILAGSCAAQTPLPTKRPAPKSSTARPHFICPDSEAQQACKSYSELLEAKDSGLPDTGYVCFRKHVDQFFAISFNKPYFRRTWDKDSNQSVIDPEQQISGTGWFTTYDNGVADTSVMPYLFFSGNWTPFLGGAGFMSDRINFKPEPDGHVGTVQIDDSQLTVLGYKYKNPANENVEYRLTIQRSTGRFSESFVKQDSQGPFIEGTGRCVSR